MLPREMIVHPPSSWCVTVISEVAQKNGKGRNSHDPTGTPKTPTRSYGKEADMKDWILIALLILLAAMALGLFGFFGLQGFIWDRAYDQALSKYGEAYAHRDDSGN